MALYIRCVSDQVIFVGSIIVHLLGSYVLQAKPGSVAMQDLQIRKRVSEKCMCKKPVTLHLRLQTNEAHIVAMVQRFQKDLQELNAIVEENRAQLLGLKKEFQDELSKVNRNCLSA